MLLASFITRRCPKHVNVLCGFSSDTEWEKQVQRDASLRSGPTKGSRGGPGMNSMHDNFMSKLEGDFAGERVSSLNRVELRLQQQIKDLAAFREKILASKIEAHSLLEYNKQRTAAQNKRQELIVTRELSGMGTGSHEAVINEYPIPLALPT